MVKFNASESGQELIDLGDLQLRQYATGKLTIRKKVGNGTIFNVVDVEYGESKKLVIKNIEITINNKKVSDGN